MSWSEIKHAVNSTVGTDDFEPLDKIFKGNWRFIVSENIYLTEDAFYTQDDDTFNISTSFKALINGTVRVSMSAATSSGRIFSFHVLKNGEIAASVKKTGTGEALTYISEVTFAPGDVLSFKFERESSGGSIISTPKLTIYGIPVYAPELFERMG